MKREKLIIDQYVLLGFSHGKKFVSFKQLKLINAFCCYFRPIDHDKGSDSNCNGIYVSSQLIKEHIMISLS